MSELQPPRPILHHLLAARSGHGDFADYHERFAHEGADLECSCGRRKAPEHFLICDKVRPRDQPRLRGDHRARAHALLAGVRTAGQVCWLHTEDRFLHQNMPQD
jgi:hypothetical protein